MSKKSDIRTLKSDNRTIGQGSKEPLSCPISFHELRACFLLGV